MSEEFKNFLAKNGITQVVSPPYHPSSNGLAERAVQIVKRGLKKVTEGTLSDRLARVLFSYRLIPQSTTGSSPAELFLGRTLQLRLDKVLPDIAQSVAKKQEKQQKLHGSQPQ